MILKAPFSVPPNFLLSLGYNGGRRFVALYWEPSGDEACFDDGVSSACGLCDNWLYLGFIRQPDMQRWLNENELNLGNSDERARHWLVVDAQTSDLYAAPHAEACRILHTQSVPKVNLPEG
jgi:hypothetical protein